jgi:hypothetical protein
MVDATRGIAPGLVTWLLVHPAKALTHEQHWEKLVGVVQWIGQNPATERYVREVDVAGVDTKFIEQHRTVLAELLDVQLPPERIDQAYKPAKFAQRYRFRTKPATVRLRSLAGTGAAPFEHFTDITVRVDELAEKPLDVHRILVVENEITFLALPAASGTVALLGGGYAVPRLEPLTWLRDRELLYWGDIDTHGLAILDRLRRIFPHTQSVLMDEETLLGNQEHWGREAEQETTTLTRLTPAESQLHEDLVADQYGVNVRLEQERLRFGDVRRALSIAGVPIYR